MKKVNKKTIKYKTVNRILTTVTELNIHPTIFSALDLQAEKKQILY